MWDNDSKDVILPKELVIPEDVLVDVISDYISEMTGYCLKGFDIVVAPKESSALIDKEFSEMLESIDRFLHAVDEKGVDDSVEGECYEK